MANTFKLTEKMVQMNTGVIEANANEFKELIKGHKISYQKLSNRFIYLFLKNEDFRNQLLNCTDLARFGC